MSRLHEWNLLGLPLVTAALPKSGFWFETYADGFSLGSPEGTAVVRRSLMLDGDDERLERWGNRTIEFTVAVCGHTPEDVHQGERELAMRMGVPGALEWLPPRSGPRTVYDVRWARMQMAFDDLEWLRGVIHQPYAVSVRAAPWAYSEKVVSETFAPASSALTVLSNGSSAANWPGLTAGTYLSQSVVSTPWVEPMAIGRAGAYLTYSPTVVSANEFVFADIAAESYWNGYVPHLVGASPEEPLTSVPQANGFTRFFWKKPASGRIEFRVGVGARTRFHLDQMGTATGVPGGSIFTLRTQGSVRVPARLHLNRVSGENMIYSDPTMLTHGWSPSIGETWASAPEGTYYLYVYPLDAYTDGDVFSLYFEGMQKGVRTRVEWTSADNRWFPLGPFHFGGNLSRRVGTRLGGIDPFDGLPYGSALGATMTLKRNGVNTASSVNPVRLIREHEDASLLHVRGSSGRMFVDPASFDVERPGVFSTLEDDTDGADATTLLPTTDSWAWPVIVPPITALWVQNTTSGGTHGQQGSFEMTVCHRPAGHTLAPVVVGESLVVGEPSGGTDAGGGG